MRETNYSDMRQDALLENFERIHARANALGTSDAQEFARVLARCAQRMGISPPKHSAS